MEFIPPKDEHAFLCNFPKSKTFDKLKKKSKTASILDKAIITNLKAFLTYFSSHLTVNLQTFFTSLNFQRLKIPFSATWQFFIGPQIQYLQMPFVIFVYIYIFIKMLRKHRERYL